MSLTKFTSITGTCVPVPGPDMDTDRIIPSRFLKCVTFEGLGEHAFADDIKGLTDKGEVHPFRDPLQSFLFRESSLMAPRMKVEALEP